MIISDDHTLLQKNLAHHWHPCTQMKDLQAVPPLVIQKAEGPYLYTTQGKFIDGISSWWCKSLGHQHPDIVRAIEQQLGQFEHVISAHTTHPTLVALAEQLAEISHLPYVFFASDGSSAVEIALKLAIHSRQIEGQPEKKRFIALKNGYHGETLGALSVSDLGKFKAPYADYCFPCDFIEIPHTSFLSDPDDSSIDAFWQSIEAQLNPIKHTLNAIIFEPIIQGAAGMRCYHVAFLKRLMTWAKQNDVLCIADEIMTGFCRTGQWFATHYTGLQPDLICVSKGLTGGHLPLSAVLISQKIYDYFYHDYEKNHNFLHSHTFSGHALGLSAALATIQILQQTNMNDVTQQLQKHLRTAFNQLKEGTQKITNIRGLGGIIAADFLPDAPERIGFKFYQAALKEKILLRPIGNTLYWFPPLNLSASTLTELTERTYRAILASYDA